MNRMGVHAQVLFPAFFIRYNTTNPEAEAALAKSYNRWLAGRCAHSNGRLCWAAVLPFLDTDDTVDELRWAKAHGACGFFKRGFDLYKQVSDPHFFPVYEEAAALEEVQRWAGEGRITTAVARKILETTPATSTAWEAPDSSQMLTPDAPPYAAHAPKHFAEPPQEWGFT